MLQQRHLAVEYGRSFQIQALGCSASSGSSSSSKDVQHTSFAFESDHDLYHALLQPWQSLAHQMPGSQRATKDTQLLLPVIWQASCHFLSTKAPGLNQTSR